MRLLSEDQRDAINRVIEDNRLSFLAEVLGPDAIPRADYERLKRAGKVKAPSFKVDPVTAAHVLGALVGESSDERTAETVTSSAFLSVVVDRSDALTPTEQEAIDVAKDRVGVHLKGLTDRLAQTAGRLVTESEDKARRERQLAVVRDVAKRGLRERETASQIAAKFKAAAQDTSRDWLKVAQTEIHNVMDEGRAAQIMKHAPRGSDPLVYKRPRPDACVFCNLLYLNGKVPRVFRMSELVANGTNVDRKARRPMLTGPYATEWRPVVGSTHPWCACSLHYMPDGFAFDRHGMMQYVGVRKALAAVEHLDHELLDHDCVE